MTIEQLKELINTGVKEASRMTDLSSGRNKTEWRLILGERLWFKTLLNAVDYKPVLSDEYIVNDIQVIKDLTDKLQPHNCSSKGLVYCNGKCTGCIVGSYEVTNYTIGKDEVK